MTDDNGKPLRDRGYRFTHVKLANWKNFRSVDQALQSRVFLVGPNASGKSNFLDAFRFLHDIATVGGGLQSAVRRRKGVSALRCLAARRQPHVGVSVTIGNAEVPEAWRYELEFTQDNNRIPIVTREVVWEGDRKWLDRPDDEDKKDAERLTQTFLEQVNANREFRDVNEFLRSLRYLHVVPQLVREPDRSIGRSNDPFGGDFLEQIARTPIASQKSRLKKIRAALQAAVPQLVEIELKRDESGTPHVHGRYEHWRPQGAWQSEEQFSDGTLRLMGMLWALLEGTGPLLLEEPELSLHPEVVRVLPQLFARVQRRRKRQILLTSHSHQLLLDQGIGLDEVFVLEPHSEGTRVVEASSIGEVRRLLEEGVSLSDALLPRVTPRDLNQLMLFDDR